jgi:predicted deacetylase
MTQIAFRMDDICPEMDWGSFSRFRNLFDQYDIRPLLGIVPDNQDSHLKISAPHPEFWKEMRTLVVDNQWSIAQHGYRHLLETRGGGLLGINKFSEFASFPYDIQYKKIEEGKKCLSENGVETDIWMAPAHSYDQNTLRALCNLGFRIVTDGYSLYPYNYMGLKFIPCQFGDPRKPPFGIATIAIHCNGITEGQFQRFSLFVEKNRDFIVDFRELCALPTKNLSRKIIEPSFLALRKIKNVLVKNHT